MVVPHPVPMVIRSMRHVCAELGIATPTLPIAQVGTTYTMAQVASWVDAERYAVGRWDGTMSIFDFSDGPDQRPKITVAVSTPSTEGVQMIEWLADGVIATSNDDASMLVWGTKAGDWEDIREVAKLAYDPALGAANSAVRCLLGAQVCMIVGHANGFLTIWVGTDPRKLSLARAPVDLRSAEPTNPWGYQNIRGVSLCSTTPADGALVYTGSENGLLCLVEVPSGNVISRTVYNSSAKRGINAIASVGKHLVVANCAAGPADKNIWYYVLDAATSTLKLISAFNLAVDSARLQTFNFDVAWCTYHQDGGDRVGVLSTTEEGYLWLLRLQDDSLGIVGKQKITSPLGSALAVNTRGQLAVSAYDLYNYQLAQPTLLAPSNHPGQLTAAMLGIT